MGNIANKLCCSCFMSSDIDDDHNELIVCYTKKQIVEIYAITNENISIDVSNESILSQNDNINLDISFKNDEIRQLTCVNKLLAQIPLKLDESLFNNSKNSSQKLTRSIIDYINSKLFKKQMKLKQKKSKNGKSSKKSEQNQLKSQAKPNQTLGISPICELFLRFTDINFI
jgi:hypothetical protein